MKNQFYVFYSWQSDVEGNKQFINKKIKEAVEDIQQMEEFSDSKIIYDHSTQNRSGSPSIVDTIHEKINTCDVFIADITPIAEVQNKKDSPIKLIPNPNVMAECGFALRSIGEKRIILLFRKDKGLCENLPFDIRHRRISVFNIRDERFSIKEYILAAIRESLYCNDNLFNQNTVSHDSDIFKRLQSLDFNNTDLMGDLKYIVNNQRISQWQYNWFEKIANFLEDNNNMFLIPELKEQAELFVDSISDFVGFMNQNFNPMQSAWISVFKSVDKVDISKDCFYSWIDRASGEYLEEEKYHERLTFICENLLKFHLNFSNSSKNFRRVVHENLFI